MVSWAWIPICLCAGCAAGMFLMAFAEICDEDEDEDE